MAQRVVPAEHDQPRATVGADERDAVAVLAGIGDFEQLAGIADLVAEALVEIGLPAGREHGCDRGEQGGEDEGRGEATES